MSVGGTMKKKERRYDLEVSVNKRDDEEGGSVHCFSLQGQKALSPIRNAGHASRQPLNDRADVGK